MNEPVWLSDLSRFLLAWHCKGVILLLATWSVAGLLKKQSAAGRHLCWICGLIALLPLALAGSAFVDLPIPLPYGTWLDSGQEEVGIWQGSSVPGKVAVESNATPSAMEADGVSVSGSQAGHHRVEAGSKAIEAASAAPGAGWSILWVVVWMLGSVSSGLYFLAGEIAAHRVASHAGPIRNRVLQARLRKWASDLGTSPPRLRLSGAIQAPFTRGVIQPVLVFPRSWSKWSRDQLDRVLLHELSHIKRRDFLSHRLAKMAACLQWINPFCWVALRRIVRNQEMACDDEVVRLSESGLAYAEDLLCWARSGTAFSGRLGVAGARSGLEERLRALLDRHTCRRSLLPRQVLLATAATVSLAFLLGSVQLVDASLTPSAAQPSGVWATLLEDGQIQFQNDQLIEIEGIGTLRGSSRGRRFHFREPVVFRIAGQRATPGSSLRADKEIEVSDQSGRELWTIRLARKDSDRPRGRRVGSARGTGVSFVFEPGEPSFYLLRYQGNRIQIEGWVYRALEIGAKMDPLPGTSSGLEIRAILEAGPAEEAGLRVHDVITAIEGQPATRSALYGAMESKNSGDSIHFEMQRAGRTSSASVVLRSSQPTQQERWKGRKYSP